ncbi:MAG: serine/threonine protein kinase [Planctomycetes bacterium]|nr:serine/threonine protein kinase [Planctomycetota bacterium]
MPGLIASGDGLVLPSLTRGPDVDEEPPSDELLEKLGLHAPDTKRYRFRGRIGTGGQGVVLKVWDAKLSRPLAMKIVLGSAQDQPTGETPRVDGRRLTRFVDEARIASQLNHPGIVPVHELGADESGRAFFTMKLVKGDDLSRIFEKVKRGEDGIGLPRAVSYLLRVCEAMAYAHDRGVIHRDLKPANVMVGAYGEVHVMDWGLARVIGDAASDVSAPRARATEPISQVDSVRRAERSVSPDSPLFTEHGLGVGTPCYMSPEQARGDHAAVGPASDIYAVGAMLYQLLTGTPPYLRPGERRTPEFIAIATVERPPPPVESLAPRAIPELVAICEPAMARAPAARYASMRALASDLQAFLDGHVVSAYETGAWAETRKWVKRNRALAGALTAAFVGTATGGALAWRYGARVSALRHEAQMRSDAEWSMQRLIEFRAQSRDASFADRIGEPATDWWLRTAGELVRGSPNGARTGNGRRPGIEDHRKSLDAIRRLGTPASCLGFADGRNDAAPVFGDAELRWRFGQLSNLVKNLSDLSQRRQVAESSVRGTAAETLWNHAIESLAKHDAYAGVFCDAPD